MFFGTVVRNMSTSTFSDNPFELYYDSTELIPASAFNKKNVLRILTCGKLSHIWSYLEIISWHQKR